MTLRRTKSFFLSVAWPERAHGDVRAAQRYSPGDGGCVLLILSSSVCRNPYSNGLYDLNRYKIWVKILKILKIMSTAINPPRVRATFVRWVEDELDARGATWEQLTEAVTPGAPKKMSRLVNGHDTWSLDQVLAVASFFDLHWYDDLVSRWGLGRETITLAAASELAMSEGRDIDLTYRAA